MRYIAFLNSQWFEKYKLSKLEENKTEKPFSLQDDEKIDMKDKN